MAVSGPCRPNPDELLRRIQAEERRERRGRLKVFLGYASHVGKSLRMFDEGRRRKQRGEDVVVCLVQTSVTPEIRQILSSLEIIPTTRERHAGRVYEAIDMASILRRRPQICLIDELAYDNPPGSRNARRWQDVNELLDRGISVVTALNLQHIAEQQDAVERITGKRAMHSVPQAFLHDADDIELVEAPASAAASQDPEQLAELRELALLLAADVVDRQLQGYLSAHGIAMQWGVQERILVCLTPQSDARLMLASGQRNARRFHGALLAVVVGRPPRERAAATKLEANLELARQAGAEVHRLPGRDFVGSVLEFARSQRVTQLFLGHSLRPRRWRLTRDPIDRLLDRAEEFDVRLFPHQEEK
ncbi:MAG TPA: hypothetical protein VG675_24690 [Bryobacteraceae bacterium]|nr:hypothetical protein [Bryobacteraceae bacterium]